MRGMGIKGAGLIPVSMQSGGQGAALILTISATGATANVVAIQIVASEVVAGFAVGDITISAGGSLNNFATADNITFTVDWTLAPGANSMDIAAGVCTGGGKNNQAATQFTMGYMVLQPGAAAGIDASIVNAFPTLNYGASNIMYIGEWSGLARIYRSLIKFDLSTLTGKTVLSARLGLYHNGENSDNTRNLQVFRQKRAWVEGTGNGGATGDGATWNKYDAVNNWQTAGGFGADDCEQTNIGSLSLPEPIVDGWKDVTLTASAIQEIADGTWTNNGFLLKMETETDDEHNFSTSDHAVAALWPKFEAVYYPFDLSTLSSLPTFVDCSSAINLHYVMTRGGILELTNGSTTATIKLRDFDTQTYMTGLSANLQLPFAFTGASCKLGIITDTHFGRVGADPGGCLAVAIADLDALGVTDVFVLGDICEEVDAYDDYIAVRDTAVVANWHELTGNHDVAQIAAYKAKLGYAESYFSVTLGNCVFIMLGNDTAGGAISAAAITFLSDTLTANADKNCFIMSHIGPRYTTRCTNDAVEWLSIGYLNPVGSIEAAYAGKEFAAWIAGHSHGFTDAPGVSRPDISCFWRGWIG